MQIYLLSNIKTTVLRDGSEFNEFYTFPTLFEAQRIFPVVGLFGASRMQNVETPSGENGMSFEDESAEIGKI